MQEEAVHFSLKYTILFEAKPIDLAMSFYVWRQVNNSSIINNRHECENFVHGILYASLSSNQFITASASFGAIMLFKTICQK